MALQSSLFSGDAALEAAAISDPAHILPGARGTHVAKIQTALNILDDAALTTDGIYGNGTANAVLAYKQARGIINTSYQSSADNIVGRMTIAALDAEMLEAEDVPDIGFISVRAVNRPLKGNSAPQDVAHVRNSFAGQPSGGLLLGFAFNFDPNQKLPNGPPLELRLKPRDSDTLVVTNGKGAFVKCVNVSQFRNFELNERTAVIFDPSGPANQHRLVPEPRPGGDPDLAFGGSMTLSQSKQDVGVDGYKPGNAHIEIGNAAFSQLVTVKVRPAKLGKLAKEGGVPKLVAPGSKGFISGDEGQDCPGGLTKGRPIGSRTTGGRNINLGGEGETPGFENYTADIDFSDFMEFPARTKRLFRPWSKDEDSNVGIGSGGAGNICIRGTPITPEIIREILRIAEPGCRMTFDGSKKDMDALIAGLGGWRQIDLLNGPQDFAVVLERP